MEFSATQLTAQPSLSTFIIRLHSLPSISILTSNTFKQIGSTMEGENEIIKYFKVWLQVVPSLCYCFFIGKLLPPTRISRLLAILPVFFFFLYLPLRLNSIHLGGTLAFFIAWLANFKLLLFAFGEGPLSHPPLSLKRFVAIASLPIKIHENENSPPQSKHKSQNSNRVANGGTTLSRDSLTNGRNRSGQSNTDEKLQKKGHKSLLNYAIKGLIFAGILRCYDYSDNFHPNLLLTLYCLHIYVCLEIVLVMFAFMARTLLGMELEPQFNEPYLSFSLQDFWGRRWNIMVSKILRPTVYEPSYNMAVRVMGRKWASLPAVLATFVVSALMHELMFYYLGRVRPTWEITWFFLLHGFCLVIEIGLKKKLTGRFRLPRVVSGPLTVGFVMVTAFWLFLPQLLRCKGDERALQEYAAVGAFVKDVWSTLTVNASRFLGHKEIKFL